MYKKYVMNTECPLKELTQEKRSPLIQPVNDEFDFADNVANTYRIYSNIFKVKSLISNYIKDIY